MAELEVAAFQEQGVDVIVVPLDRSFGGRTSAEQREIVAELQSAATSAGLPGQVVPVWETSDGRMGFMAPRNWHPFFSGISLMDVARNINYKLRF